MRKRALGLSIIASVLAISASAHAQEASMTVIGERQFKAQGFTLTEQPAVEFRYKTCSDGGLCLKVAHFNTGDPAYHETDVYLIGDIGPLTVQAGIVEGKGPETGDVIVSKTFTVNDTWSSTISSEVMRGGFNDTIATIAFDGTGKLSGRWSWNASAQFAYSDFASTTTFGGQVGGSRNLGQGVSASGFVTGYLNKDGSDVTVAVSLAKKFN